MNLANLLKNEKTPESTAEAKELYHEVIAGYTEHYGPRHVKTLQTKMNLANLLMDTNVADDLWDAQTILNQVTPLYTEHYGPDHRDTLNAHWGSARLLYKMGQRVESKDLFERTVIPGLEAAVGQQHPWYTHCVEEFNSLHGHGM